MNESTNEDRAELHRILDEADHWQERAAAARHLGELGSENDLPALKRAMRCCRDTSVVRAATEAVMTIERRIKNEKEGTQNATD
jgi:HEAT repeat protein